MAPLPKIRTIEHFTHPNHQLIEIKNDNEYLCDGCKTHGIGTRFRCNQGCDFDLHEYCATSPMTLSSFMHQHQLNLVVRKQQASRQNDRICDVCGHPVEGLFYRCKLCEFDVHPLCTQLPQQLRHVLHPAHLLTLQSYSPSLCLVCKTVCKFWRYRCGICGVDIHLDCLLTRCDHGSTSTTRSVPQPRGPPAPVFGANAYNGVPYFGTFAYGFQQAPPCGAFAYGVPSASFSPYNHNMYHHQPYQHGNHQQVGEGRFRHKIYELVGSIALGVINNMVFGT